MGCPRVYLRDVVMQGRWNHMRFAVAGARQGQQQAFVRRKPRHLGGGSGRRLPRQTRDKYLEAGRYKN